MLLEANSVSSVGRKKVLCGIYSNPSITTKAFVKDMILRVARISKKQGTYCLPNYFVLALHMLLKFEWNFINFS